MYKIAAIIGGVLLMAGVALAGTVSSLGSPNSPTIGQTIPTASAHVRQEDRGVEQEPGDDRGRETEARGRANEPGEDLREDRGVTRPSTPTTRAAPAPRRLPQPTPTSPTAAAATTTAAPARPTPARATAPAVAAVRTTAATPATADTAATTDSPGRRGGLISPLGAASSSQSLR